MQVSLFGYTKLPTSVNVSVCGCVSSYVSPYAASHPVSAGMDGWMDLHMSKILYYNICSIDIENRFIFSAN